MPQVRDRMYLLASRIANERVWEKLPPESFYAVAMPSGRTGYCTLHTPETDGFVVYVGADSLTALQETKSSQMFRRLVDTLIVYKLQCKWMSYEITRDWEPPNLVLTEDEDLEEVFYGEADACEFAVYDEYLERQHRARSLRDTEVYPAFFRIRPYGIGESLSVEDEDASTPYAKNLEVDLRDLLECMEATVELGKQLRRHSAQELGFAPLVPAQTVHLPYFQREAAKHEEVSRIRLSTQELYVAAMRSWVTPKAPMKLVSRLQKLPRKGELLGEIIRVNELALDEDLKRDLGDASWYFPAMLVLISREDEKAIWLQIFAHRAYDPAEVVEGFCKGLLEYGSCPNKLYVCTDETQAVLADVCKAADISLEKVPMGAKPVAALESYIAGDNLNEQEMDENYQQMVNFVRILEDLPDSELRRMPTEIARAMLLLANNTLDHPEDENNVMSVALAKRIQRTVSRI